jgi:hypothetical protein
MKQFGYDLFFFTLTCKRGMKRGGLSGDGAIPLEEDWTEAKLEGLRVTTAARGRRADS